MRHIQRVLPDVAHFYTVYTDKANCGFPGDGGLRLMFTGGKSSILGVDFLTKIREDGIRKAGINIRKRARKKDEEKNSTHHFTFPLGQGVVHAPGAPQDEASGPD